MKTIDIILNFLIFVITLVLLVRFARKDGVWVPERLKYALRYFTCQSNIFCAATALLTAVALLAGNEVVPRAVWTLKYIGTAAVTVTMLTVFIYLWPMVGKGGLKRLLGGSDLFMHLITPLLAILSFCLTEKQGMTFPQSLWGLLPLILYGPLYIYRVLYAPEGKRWDDFYGFNKQGKWPLAFAMMLAGSLCICMLFMLAQNA